MYKKIEIKKTLHLILMSNLVKQLDKVEYNKNKNKNKNNYNTNKLTNFQLNNLLIQYSYNYFNYMTDPYINIANHMIETKGTPIIENISYKINTKIETINDLIKIIENYSNIVNIKDNIQLCQLNKIKEPLIELDKMIGMIDLKNDILNQILFYIQKLHIKNGMEYMHTVLSGPPGTGKTEVAKIIGNIFAQLGILENNKFTKVVRSDLIAGYLGQTAIKTTKVIESSLGGVLFIDEAYALGNSEKRDSFAKECIDTLCEALSNHKDKLMVIIAGYQQELDECFFSFNPGLRSRFPWSFKTDKYSYEDLYNIFCKKVRQINWTYDKNISKDFFKVNIKYFMYYGRDIETFLSKTKIAHGRRVFTLDDNIKTIITNEDLEDGLKLFIKHSYKKDDDTNYIGHLYN